MNLKKLKLAQINHVGLRQNEMEHLIGAESCQCACKGSVSTQDTGQSNFSGEIPQQDKTCSTWGETFWRANLDATGYI